MRRIGKDAGREGDVFRGLDVEAEEALGSVHERSQEPRRRRCDEDFAVRERHVGIADRRRCVGQEKAIVQAAPFGAARGDGPRLVARRDRLLSIAVDQSDVANERFGAVVDSELDFAALGK